MIDNVLDVIREQADTFLKLKMRDNREQYIHLVPVIDMQGKPAVNENAICMSLVKIEEEKNNRRCDAQVEYKGNDAEYYNPPIKLNLYVLFSVSTIDGQEKNYKEALKQVSRVIGFFQAKNVFTPSNTPLLDHSVGKITAELHELTMEEQNNLWSMLGGSYRPSVLYKLRSLIIQEKYLIGKSGPVLERDFQLEQKQ